MSIRMTRLKSGFDTCRMLLISSLTTSSESLGWPSTSHQFFFNIIRLWLWNKAFLGIPKWNFFCGLHLLKWTCAIRYGLFLCYMEPAHNILCTISPYTNCKVNVVFPHLLSIRKKKQLAAHKYLFLINFFMCSKRK